MPDTSPLTLDDIDALKMRLLGLTASERHRLAEICTPEERDSIAEIGHSGGFNGWFEEGYVDDDEPAHPSDVVAIVP